VAERSEARGRVHRDARCLPSLRWRRNWPTYQLGTQPWATRYAAG